MKDTLSQALLSKIRRTTVCVSRLSHMTLSTCKRKKYFLNIDICRVTDPKQATALRQRATFVEVAIYGVV
jgi:hypothetical protein